MKKLKKLLAVVLTFTFMLTMNMSVLAADATDPDTTTEYTMTITGSGGYTFTAYQIFQGTYSDAKGNLSNIKWADNLDSRIKAAIANAFGLADDATASAVAEKLSGNAEEKAKTFAAAINNEWLGTAAGSVTIQPEQNTGVIEHLKAGYYYVVTEAPDGVTPENIGSIVNVVGNVNIVAKVVDQPTFEKKVEDVNDSTGVESGLQDSADYDIGDAVPFTLTAKLPSNVTTHNSYNIQFRDQMSPGLTFNKDSVEVYVKHNGTERKVTGGYVVSNGTTVTGADDARYNNGTEFTVTIADVLAAPISAKESDEIIVRYNATLNENAIVGSAGNPNRAKLEYDSDYSKDTAWDVNIVFTYTVNVNKVDPENKALTGAEFKLEKLVNGEWEVLDLQKNAAGTQFSFKGLDDGQYRLTETKAPDGYNGIDPIYFEVTAIHDEEADAPTLTDITTIVKDKEFKNTLETGETLTFSSNKDLNENNANIDANIVNKQGIVLPSTGGIGTTLFYVIGGILMLGAVVLLVAKKRTHK